MGKTLMDSTSTSITISTWTQTKDIWAVELFPNGGKHVNFTIAGLEVSHLQHRVNLDPDK